MNDMNLLASSIRAAGNAVIAIQYAVESCPTQAGAWADALWYLGAKLQEEGERLTALAEKQKD